MKVETIEAGLGADDNVTYPGDYLDTILRASHELDFYYMDVCMDKPLYENMMEQEGDSIMRQVPDVRFHPIDVPVKCFHHWMMFSAHGRLLVADDITNCHCDWREEKRCESC
jgi:hypothetical protein